MKKISILLFAVMMAGGLSAQIEEVSAEDYAPKKQDVKQKSIPQEQYPANLLKRPYDLMGQQLYCVQEEVETYYKPASIVSVVIYPDSTIGVKKIKKGAYYTVIDIISSQEQLHALQTRLIQSKNYDKTPYKCVWMNKEKTYQLTKTKKNDIPGFLSNGGSLYVLLDEAGIQYFVAWRRAEYDDVKYVRRYDIPSGFVTGAGNPVPYLCSPSIGDFISVNTYNYLKNKYTNKELVHCEYYDPKCQRYYSKEEYAKEEIKKKYIWKVEKVGVEKCQIVLVMDRDGYKEKRAYINEGVCVISAHNDTVPGVCFEGYSNAPFPMRSDIDSLMKRWYKEEQIKEAQARAERAKQKAEYVKKYGAKYAQNIIDGKVCVGMTKEMCLMAMGRPNNTSRSSNSLGVVEVWTYSTWYQMFGGLAPIIVVTFLDDKVTSVDEYKENLPF